MIFFKLSQLVVTCILVLSGTTTSFGQLGAPKRLTFNQIQDLVPSINSASGVNGAVLTENNFDCATEQLVAGKIYRIYYNNGQCEVVVSLQVWLSPEPDITFKCKDGTGSKNDMKILEGLQVCEKAKEQTKFKRSLDENIGVVKMEKNNFGYDPKVKRYFDDFIRGYGRDYSETADSETYRQRYEIFAKNLRIVETLNLMETNAVYGINKFMDYSYEEYKKYLAPGLTKPLVSIRDADMSGLDANDIPDSVDWREKGAVTAVKNQGQCGSCWAFSTTGNVEGQWFLKHGKLYSLSEQELVDCDSLDQGCNGGLPSNAYKSIEKLGGLETESDYPYEAENEKCNIKKSDFKVFVNDSVALPKDEGQLAAWLAKNGPISIGINANMMQFYFGGIAHPWKIFCNPSSLDHGVLIVGYGTENGTPFWIIKNSWGPDWGEKGYYRIYRGDGSCGLNMMATSAIID